jgi:hypothetical protein
MNTLIQLFTIFFLSNFLGGCGSVDSGSSSLTKKDENQTPGTVDSPSTGVVANQNPIEITLIGSCPAEATSVAISNPIDRTVACVNGEYSVIVNLSSLTDGVYVVTLTFNYGPAGQRPLVVNRETPQLSLSTIVNGMTGTITTQNASAYTVSGNCNSADGNVAIKIGSVVANTQCLNGSFTANLDLTTLANGTYRGSISQTDPSGNKTTSYFEVFKDTSGGSVLTNQSNPQNVRQIVNTSGTEGQSIKGTNAGYRVIATIGAVMATGTVKKGSNGSRVEAYLRAN